MNTKTTNTKDSDLDTLHAMSVYGGGFVKAISQAAYVADSQNYKQLKAAFPQLWTEYEHLTPKHRGESWFNL